MIIWEPIEGTNGAYKVSNYGQVMSGERMLKQAKHPCGYLRVTIYFNGKPKPKYVHRLVLQAFLPTDLLLDTNHINGIKTDNRLENLEWATRKENIKHSIENGLTKPQPTGMNSPASKFCSDGTEVVNYSEGAKRSGYSIAQFCQIMKGKFKNKTGLAPVVK